MKGEASGLGSHGQVTERPSRQAGLERGVSEEQRDLVRGRRGAWGSQDGTDLPDPIGWQLERKQRTGERRERAGKARAAEPAGV